MRFQSSQTAEPVSNCSLPVPKRKFSKNALNRFDQTSIRVLKSKNEATSSRSSTPEETLDKIDEHITENKKYARKESDLNHATKTDLIEEETFWATSKARVPVLVPDHKIEPVAAMTADHPNSRQILDAEPLEATQNPITAAAAA